MGVGSGWSSVDEWHAANQPNDPMIPIVHEFRWVHGPERERCRCVKGCGCGWSLSSACSCGWENPESDTTHALAWNAWVAHAGLSNAPTLVGPAERDEPDPLVHIWTVIHTDADGQHVYHCQTLRASQVPASW